MGRARRRKKAKLMYKKFAFFIILAIVATTLIKSTVARYRSSAHSDANVDLAFYLIEEGAISQDLKLLSILPSATPYEYDFSVANNDGTKRTETAIDYTIEIKTTTNLPLNYSVYSVDDPTTNLVASSITTTQDDDGTYYNHISVTGGDLGFAADEEDIYKIYVEFPTAYNESQYEGIVEYVQITLISSQKVS